MNKRFNNMQMMSEPDPELQEDFSNLFVEDVELNFIADPDNTA